MRKIQRISETAIALRQLELTKDWIAHLNVSIHYQLFCGVRINPLNPFTNFKIISEIRCEIAETLDIDSFQHIGNLTWSIHL